jgi:hypothetical protein
LAEALLIIELPQQQLPLGDHHCRPAIGRAFFVEGGIVVRYFLTTFSAESLFYQK